MTVAERKRLVDLLPSGLRLRNAPAMVERARMVKDDEELGLIRAAVQLGASLFDRALKVLRPGVKEAEVAAEMEYSGTAGGSGRDVVSHHHRFRGAVGAAPRPGHGANHRAGWIRGLRFRCYTRWLLLGPDPYSMGGRSFGGKREKRVTRTSR